MNHESSNENGNERPWDVRRSPSAVHIKLPCVFPRKGCHAPPPLSMTETQTDASPLKAPFPWFGGKSRAAHLIWPRLGNVPNYVEPFAGSLAVLLRRPHAPGNEIVNDLDCFVANAWRAIAAAPEEVARWADAPVFEADLHARHRWLHRTAPEFRAACRDNPDYYDAKIAGWWVWGLSCWIGDNWCRPKEQEAAPHLTGGMGVARKVPYLTGGMADAPPATTLDAAAQACRQRPPRLTAEQGANDNAAAQTAALIAWFSRLSARLRFTKICSGDWSRVCTKATTYGVGLTGVLLDPPYDTAAGMDDVYGDLSGSAKAEGAQSVSSDVRAWAIENGSNPLMRICLCGYDTEHGDAMPPDWTAVKWKAAGGYSNQSGSKNRFRETLWFSPHCLHPEGELDLGGCT